MRQVLQVQGDIQREKDKGFQRERHEERWYQEPIGHANSKTSQRGREMGTEREYLAHRSISKYIWVSDPIQVGRGR